MLVPAFLRRKGQPYDLVILDPPYADPAIGATLEMLGSSRLVESGTIVALGHWPKFDSNSVPESLRLIKRRCHGDSCFSIYEVRARDGNARMTTAIYPGSFDPITIGHVDVARRAARVFDHVIVAIYEQSEKPGALFTATERAELAQAGILRSPRNRSRDIQRPGRQLRPRTRRDDDRPRAARRVRFRIRVQTRPHERPSRSGDRCRLPDDLVAAFVCLIEPDS